MDWELLLSGVFTGTESQRATPAGPESLSPPAPAGSQGSWSSCLVAPGSPLLRATFPQLRGKLCSCFCLDRTRGACWCFFLLLDVGFWGLPWEQFRRRPLGF